MSLTFHTYDPEARELSPAAGEITAYPGGDRAVRHLEPAPTGTRPVAWNLEGTLDYQALGEWRAFHARNSTRPAVLVMPYLPSARGDRDATQDAAVAARLTAATGIPHIITADPHSPKWGDAAVAWGARFHAITAGDLIMDCSLGRTKWAGIIAPDKGAQARAGEVAERLGVPILTAGKTRDPETGKLSGFIAPEGVKAGGWYLIVDDICDGGGTFAGLAQQIRADLDGAHVHLELWTTHGLYTGNWRDKLTPNFTRIICSDPRPEILGRDAPTGVETVPLLPHVLTTLATLTD